MRLLRCLYDVREQLLANNPLVITKAHRPNGFPLIYKLMCTKYSVIGEGKKPDKLFRNLFCIRRVRGDRGSSCCAVNKDRNKIKKARGGKGVYASFVCSVSGRTGCFMPSGISAARLTQADRRTRCTPVLLVQNILPIRFC